MNWKILNNLEFAYKPNSPNLFGLDDALVGGAAFGIGSGLLSGIFGSRSQNKANQANLQAVRETNQANLDLYRQQFADQYKLWQENNEYNSPSNQMQRLRDAGLNPALMMQNGGAGIASAASVPSANPMQAAHVDPLPTIFNASDIAQSLGSLGAGFNQLSQAKNTTISNQYLDRIKQMELARGMAETKVALQTVKKGSAEESLLKAKLTMQQLENRLYSETFEPRKQSFDLQNALTQANITAATEQAKQLASDSAYKDSLTALNGIRAKFEPTVLRATIQDLVARAASSSALARYSDEQATTEIYKQFNEMARNHGLHLDNKQKELIMPYVIKSAKSASKSAASDALWNTWEHGAGIVNKLSGAYKNYNPFSLF